MRKQIYETDIEIGKLTKYATAAGLSVLALRHLIKKYKKEKVLEKFGKKNQSNNSSSIDISDLLSSIGGNR